ncbi:uncharacterized protein LOC117641606 [Thrips palmi]|uniref:Uncharacterized protein LOC117641606 n=1 Tax=Thrips palmi TaxID=161013 RepID=A0A6P8YLT7_THRPL|nr:uncharacterized protein LOC117641606 [Thrips palmi]
MAEETVPALLLSWGMSPAAIQRFIDEDISIEQFRALNELAIKLLLPNVADRAQFMKHFDKWKEPGTKSSGPLSKVNAGASTSGEPPQKKPRKGKAKATLPVHNPPAQPLSVSEEEPSINYVHRILKAKREGEWVLAYYNYYGELSDSSRDDLSKRIITAELQDDKNQRISRQRYSELADMIVELFPTETHATWYSLQTEKGRTYVDGRLWHKFYNTRRKYATVGWILRSTLEDEILEDEGLELPQEEDEEDENILWLFANDTPWIEVLSKWELSIDQRQKYMKRGLYAYTKLFPALELEHGWELLLLDSNIRYPDFQRKCDTDWPKFISFIESELRKVKDLEFPAEFQTNDERTVTVLEHLAFIFKPRVMPKPEGERPKSKSVGIWKPSRKEVQLSFVLRVDDIKNIKEIVSSRRNVLNKYGHTLQPFVLLVGSPHNIRQSFVMLDDLRWPVSPPLKAVDVCFKLFFVLRAGYPVESRHIWLYIQHCVYSHESSDDYKGCRGLKSFLASHFKSFKRCSS